MTDCPSMLQISSDAANAQKRGAGRRSEGLDPTIRPDQPLPVTR